MEINLVEQHGLQLNFDLLRGRPIWFGGEDRSAASMSQFYAWLGERKSSRLRLAVMDMWKPFRLATQAQAPQAAILFDKFHYEREGWARRFFDNWRAGLKWQRLNSYAKFMGDPQVRFGGRGVEPNRRFLPLYLPRTAALCGGG